MPGLAAASDVNTAFSTGAYRPTALFVGGTSGVGEASAKTFAKAAKGNCHIIICGRSKAKAEVVISSFLTTPESKYEFVECDVSLMRNIVKACDDIRARLGPAGTLNYLVESQGVMTLDGFIPTDEGIDRKLAVHFYSRWKFVDELLPLLEKAATSGQEARMLNIFGPSSAVPLDADDLGLKKNYSLLRAGWQPSTYNNLMTKEYAINHPDVAFIHIGPGSVATPIVTRNESWYLKAFGAAVKCIFAKSPDDCGQWMVFGLTSPEFRSGAFYLTEQGDPLPTKRLHIEDDKYRSILVTHYQDEVKKAAGLDILPH